MRSKLNRWLNLVVALAVLSAPVSVVSATVTATSLGSARSVAPVVSAADLPYTGVLPAWAVVSGPSDPSGRLVPRVALPLKQDVSLPMRQMAPIPPAREMGGQSRPFLALPKAQAWGDDIARTDPGVVQDWLAPNALPAPIVSFEGVDNQATIVPPDTEGDIGYDPATGTRYYFQWVNLWYAIWDVTNPLNPTKVYPPDSGFANGNTPWQGFGGYCEYTNDGDPIVLFDPLAERWFMSQFALPNHPNGPFLACIAVSQTADPTGAWYRYAYDWVDEFGNPVMNDYPKFGVWPDGYYMTVNQFHGSSPHCDGVWCGAGVAAFERDKMLLGQPARMVAFDLAGVNIDYGGMLPADLDGSLEPPAGAPNTFVEWDNGGILGPGDGVRLWEFHVDWTNPLNSTFGLGGDPNLVIPTANVNPDAPDIPQPDTSQPLDEIDDRLMYRLAYRNFGSRETLVTNHTVNSGGRAGIHWFELSKSGGGAWDLAQEGIYAPGDGHHRWMASIAQDHVGNMGLGFSVSSSSLYPSIRYTGRLVSDPPGTMPQGEGEFVSGGGSQTVVDRWGDYSTMSVDPVDDCTFWYTQEYYPASSPWHWHTRIGAFRFPNCTLGETGVLSGVVYDSGGTPETAPIVGASIQATGATVARTSSTTSGPSGVYAMLLMSDTYTVTASAYGYVPTPVGGVSVLSGTTTTLSIPLTQNSTVVLSGTVADANTGWPLYARLDILPEGYPGATVWNDPVSGWYSVTLPAGVTHTIEAHAWVDGYEAVSRIVLPLSDHTEDFDLDVDTHLCNAPGYTRTPGCVPLAGGLVVGTVNDGNTGSALVGARVINSDGFAATTESTPDDPDVGDGLYILFSSAGTRVFTATRENYEPGVITVNVVQSETVGMEDFFLRAGRLSHTPLDLTAAIPIGLNATVQLTLTNTGSVPLDFVLTEEDLGSVELGGGRLVSVTIPGAEASFEAENRFTKRRSTVRPEITFTVEEVRSPAGGVEVLLLTPDEAGGGDISVISTTLAAFGDLNVTLWTDVGTGDPSGTDLAPYDVVIVGNDLLWNGGGMTPTGVGDGLADYIDGGGKVIDTLFVYDYSDWALGGRYISEGYGPFTQASADRSALPYELGTVYDSIHPIMHSVSQIVDNPIIGISHQDVGLADGATRLADWDDGEIYVAYNDDVVGVNQLWYHGASWTGDVPELMHNAILYVAGVDVEWMATDPISGTLHAGGEQVVDVALDAGVGAVTEPGHYRAMLNLTSDTPYDRPGVPVTMTVLPALEYGWVRGVVTSLGHCDVNPAALGEATVILESEADASYTATALTAPDGSFAWYLNQALSPLTVTVTHSDHETGRGVGVAIIPGHTATVDFYLRWLQPCLSVEHGNLRAPLAGLDLSRTLPLTLTNQGAAALEFELWESDEGSSLAALSTGGGPDQFGYTFRDSYEPDGPVYEWVDITGTGTAVSLDDDEFDGPFPIGFAFPFYGTDFSEFYISSNGWLSFDAPFDSRYDNDCPIVDSSAPNNTIAIMWDDLNPGENDDAVYYQTFAWCPYGGGACLVVLYENYHHWRWLPPSPIAGTWQAILFESGSILLQFDDAGDLAGSRSTTGIENGAGDDGLTYPDDTSCDTANSLTDTLAICFAYPGEEPSCVLPEVAWLSERPISGTLDADGGQVIVDLVFDSSYVTQTGEYYGTLNVVSSDPLRDRVSISVTMSITQDSEYRLVVAKVGSGAGTVTPSVGVYTYTAGATVWLTASAAPSSTFGGWTGAASGLTNPISVTMDSDKAITATFIATDCALISEVDFAFVPLAPMAAERVVFTASVVFTGTDSPQPGNAQWPTTHSWDFGDGSRLETGNPVTHTFPLVATERVYTVTLTASNACPSWRRVAKPVAVGAGEGVYLPLVMRGFSHSSAAVLSGGVELSGPGWSE